MLIRRMAQMIAGRAALQYARATGMTRPENDPMSGHYDDYGNAHAILNEVRLFDRAEEERWAEEVIGKCHVWGEFYGPATSKHLARALAHRYLDKQGCNPAFLAQALERWRPR